MLNVSVAVTHSHALTLLRRSPARVCAITSKVELPIDFYREPNANKGFMFIGLLMSRLHVSCSIRLASILLRHSQESVGHSGAILIVSHDFSACIDS